MYNAGDILFYKEVKSNLIDIAIADWTQSSLVHCAIAVSSTQKIEALSNGVLLTPLVDIDVDVSWNYSKIPGLYLQSALEWLHSQVGQMYGYGDVLEALLYKYEHGLVVNIGDHFDCSALACEFLLKGGGVYQLASITNPHEITPTSLYSLLTGKKL